MGNIDLTDVVTDADLAELYTIYRLTGAFVRGGWAQSETLIDGYGVVSVASPQDLEMVPEGDRLTGAMAFWSHERIYETEMDPGDTETGGGGSGTGSGYGAEPYGSSPYGGGGGGTAVVVNAGQRVSDQLVWRGLRYRVLHVYPYPNRGYWKAIGVRMAGH